MLKLRELPNWPNQLIIFVMSMFTFSRFIPAKSPVWNRESHTRSIIFEPWTFLPIEMYMYPILWSWKWYSNGGISTALYICCTRLMICPSLGTLIFIFIYRGRSSSIATISRMSTKSFCPFRCKTIIWIIFVSPASLTQSSGIWWMKGCGLRAQAFRLLGLCPCFAFKRVFLINISGAVLWFPFDLLTLRVAIKNGHRRCE